MRLGYSEDELAEANRQAIALMAEIAAEPDNAAVPMVISGCIGPRGDGYDPGKIMKVAEAEDYHAWQVEIFKQTAADMVSAITMTNVPEAIGLALAARKAQMPAAISFTVETDGNLPTGQGLADAIAEVDAATGASPAYFMINCAHPTHFEERLKPGEGWTKRIRGIRANASRCSHAELDKATELDPGNPAELGRQYRSLRQKLPHLTVLGGCCGTDHRHIGEIAEGCRLAA
jgi:S-methylmethionine-dependent homocysteine/selenocysteine methylase